MKVGGREGKMALLSLQQATKGEEIWAVENHTKSEWTVLTRNKGVLIGPSVRSLPDMSTKEVSHSL